MVYKYPWIIGVEAESSEGTPWSLWCCYFQSNRNLKQNFWLKLESTVNGGQSAWICIGNFNDVIDQNEKCEGRDVTIFSHFFLRNFISKVGALDISYFGNPFTW